MSHWATLDDVIRDFLLPTSTTLDEVRAELLQRVKMLHPDRTQGKFPDPETEANYYKTVSAVSRVDELKTRNMSLVEYSDRQVLAWKKSKTEERDDEQRLRSDISKSAAIQYRSSKIKSGVTAIAISAAMAFSSKLVEHPITSNLLAYLDVHLPVFRPVMDIVFVTGILIAVTQFAAAWKHEQKAKILSEEIVTEPRIRKLFENHPLNKAISKEGVFSANTLIEALQSDAELVTRRWVEWMPPKVTKKLPTTWRWRWTRSLFKNDLRLAQEAANLIIAKLEARNAIEPTAAGALTREYRLSPAALREVTDDP